MDVYNALYEMKIRRMDTQATLLTDRLLLEPLSENDDDFIVGLVNTGGWLRFIGNRNIHTKLDAVSYIKKVIGNQNIIYWTVKLKDAKSAIGIVTLIKRDYLEHKDIGFAFLPDFSNKGYAYEATGAVLTYLVKHDAITEILAETLPENVSSIKLLRKLGLQFEKEMEIENQILHIYRASFPFPGVNITHRRDIK
jgi:[ribosomal protein S5]-alanine N-acetyltransferase